MKTPIFALLIMTSFIIAGCPSSDESALGAADRGSDDDQTESNNYNTPTSPSPGRVVKSGKMRSDDPQVEAQVLAQVIRVTNETGLNSFAAIEPQDGAVIISPIGISESLGLAYAGAQGTTRAAAAAHFIDTGDSFTLHNTLNRLSLDVQNKQMATLKTNHGIWLPASISLLPTYLDTLAVHYGLAVNLLDSADESIQAANQWLQEQDMDLNQTPISRNTTKAGFLLTPSLTLKAAWGTQFDPSDTQFDQFNGLTEEVQVPFMRTTLSARSTISPELIAIEIPMEDSSLTMLLLSPQPDQWPQWLATLTPERLKEIETSLSPANPVELRLPKINIASTVEHKATLSAQGLGELFDANKANYAGMDGQGKLHLGNIVQHTRVKWDERGIDARDDTLIVGTPPDAQDPNMSNVTVDRPFVFILKDKTHGVIVLMSAVYELNQKAP